MTPLRAGAKVSWLLLIALGCAEAVCFLPQNSYQRWQLLDGTIHARARWIYERTHFDPTPIDVVLVGPSRTSQGVSAPRLEADLASLGVHAHVANFSLPETGRNINYAAIREMYSVKRPQLIVMGVLEKPSRFGHAAFKYLAPASEIVLPGYFSDLNYFSDLVYLPYRQMELFLADVDPPLMGLSKQFDPRSYRGTDLDTTGDIVLPGGAIKNGHDPASAAELARGVRKYLRGDHPPFLPRSLADLEFGDERHYVRAIAALAQAHGARVAFLALPYYGGPPSLQEASLYRRYGPIWNAGFVADHADWYADYAHLTRAGADHVTDWLAPKIAAALGTQAAQRSGNRS
ncbi:MAG TPA: hypothetical protein VGS12_04375 [Caulobacteraceae bacterium]|nr:hypothetical protein [Caulobacteraceae bacterium]